MQQGTVFERRGMWYLQYWRTDFVNGEDKKRRITEMRKNYLDVAFMGKLKEVS